MHRINKKEKNNISTTKTHQMPNKWQYQTCIKVSNQNLQNDTVTPRLKYVNDSSRILEKVIS